ncbi:putative molybdopterin-guanine dinucleotide biosynthesis A domain protein [Clostridioides difficile DA00165]|nr:putative molybdopterin-guanine dinucleotide biosynthesis A domain protein [Clostridioides difficile DA00165]
MRHFSNIYELSKIILEEAICIEKTGVILARNSRMGRDKAFLELHDKLLLKLQ